MQKAQENEEALQRAADSIHGRRFKSTPGYFAEVKRREDEEGHDFRLVTPANAQSASQINFSARHCLCSCPHKLLTLCPASRISPGARGALCDQIASKQHLQQNKSEHTNQD